MEECEALCDRIGILGRGNLMALGSIQHLKSKFGKGYHLEISSSVGFMDYVKEHISTVYPGAGIVEEHPERIKYSVGASGLSLSGLFEDIEKNKAKLGIIDYSVSQSSLEAVFIQLAKSDEKAAE